MDAEDEKRKYVMDVIWSAVKTDGAGSGGGGGGVGSPAGWIDVKAINSIYLLTSGYGFQGRIENAIDKKRFCDEKAMFHRFKKMECNQKCGINLKLNYHVI